MSREGNDVSKFPRFNATGADAHPRMQARFEEETATGSDLSAAVASASESPMTEHDDDGVLSQSSREGDADAAAGIAPVTFYMGEDTIDTGVTDHLDHAEHLCRACVGLQYAMLHKQAQTRT